MKKTNRGFTLIELLVVVLIIGILAAVAVPQYQKAVEKARLANVMITIKNIEDMVELHVLQNGFMSGDLLGQRMDTGSKLDRNIDLSKSFLCENDDGDCFDNYYSYASWCDNETCFWQINRWQNPENPTGIMMELEGYYDGQWHRQCSDYTHITEYLCQVFNQSF